MAATREPAIDPEPAADRREAYVRAGPPEHSATFRGIIERARERGIVGRAVSRDRPAAAPGDGGSPTDAVERGWRP